MIAAPAEMEGHSGIYAVIPNSKRVGGFIPENAYVFADSGLKPKAGDLAVCITSDFSKMTSEDVSDAQIVTVKQDSHGKVYGHISNPEEKVTGETMHKIVMIIIK